MAGSGDHDQPTGDCAHPHSYPDHTGRIYPDCECCHPMLPHSWSWSFSGNWTTIASCCRIANHCKWNIYTSNSRRRRTKEAGVRISQRSQIHRCLPRLPGLCRLVSTGRTTPGSILSWHEEVPKILQNQETRGSIRNRIHGCWERWGRRHRRWRDVSWQWMQHHMSREKSGWRNSGGRQTTTRNGSIRWGDAYKELEDRPSLPDRDSSTSTYMERMEWRSQEKLHHRRLKEAQHHCCCPFMHSKCLDWWWTSRIWPSTQRLWNAALRRWEEGRTSYWDFELAKRNGMRMKRPA